MMRADEMRTDAWTDGYPAEDPFGPDHAPDLDPDSLATMSRIELMHLAEAYGIEAEPGLPREELAQRLLDQARA